MAKQITHKSQSISFISRMYFHHPALPSPSTRPDRRKNSIEGKIVFWGKKQFLMEINVRQDKKRKKRRRQKRISIYVRWTNLRKLLTKIHLEFMQSSRRRRKLRALLLFEDMKGKFRKLFQRGAMWSKVPSILNSHQSEQQLFIELLLEVTPLGVIKLLSDLDSGWVEAAYGFTNTRSFSLLDSIRQTAWYHSRDLKIVLFFPMRNFSDGNLIPQSKCNLKGSRDVTGGGGSDKLV